MCKIEIKSLQIKVPDARQIKFRFSKAQKSCGGYKYDKIFTLYVSAKRYIYKVDFMQEENNINYKKIGERIRKLRIQRGISQIELARAIDVSQTHMSNIENGNTGISLWTAVKISRALKCSIDSFADEERYVDEQNNKVNSDNRIDIEDLITALRLIGRKNNIKK